MKQDFDAIIVGGGHNGLTCGAYLSKAGLKTLVLERRHITGGAAVTEEFSPGYSASTYSFIMGHLHPKVIAELELEKFGLKSDLVDDVISPTEDGDCIVFSKDRDRTIEQIARFSKKDAENYPKFYAYLENAVALLRRLQLETPPDLMRRDVKGLIELAKFGLRYRKVKRQEAYDILDSLSMSAYDYVSQWFETPVVKAKLMYWATIGGTVGPYAPGTAFYLVAHLIGQGGMRFCKGGMGGISDALRASGENCGMSVRTEAAVEKIFVKDGRAYGVELADGEVLTAKLIVSNLNAKLTFGELVDSKHLPEEIIDRVGRFRTRGKSFKILCACDALPTYSSFDQQSTNMAYPAYAHIGPTPQYLEKAFDDAKFGWYSEKPFLTPIVPSYYDPSLAPSGKHVVSLYGGVANHTLEGAEWDDEIPNLVKNTFNVMDEFAPGFSSTVTDYKVILPRDIERVLGMPGGNTLHGEMTLDQMFSMRPVPGLHDYRSPITALYSCGASSHPGGSVSAVPGHNAAREILKDYKRL